MRDVGRVVAIAAVPAGCILGVWLWSQTSGHVPGSALPLRLAVRTANFEFRTDSHDLNLEGLADLAEQAKEEAEAIIGATVSERTPFFICRDLQELSAVKVHFGLSPRAVTGGYYHQVPMVAVVDKPERRAMLVCHEAAHVVLGRLQRDVPTALDEGLAVLVSERVLRSTKKHREFMRGWRSRKSRVLWRAVKGGVPPLREFLFQSYREFHGPHRNRNFAMAWSLVGILAESPDPRVAGKLAGFVQRLSAADPWSVFEGTYDPDVVSKLWLDHMTLTSRSPH